jgi:hypothetical protein
MSLSSATMMSSKLTPTRKYDPLFLGRPRIVVGHISLDRDRAGHGLNDARESDQDAIAGRLDNPPPMVCPSQPFGFNERGY